MTVSDVQPLPSRSDVHWLIAIRVVVVTTLLLAALIIQFTAELDLPINYIYFTAAVAYLLTFLYIALDRMFGKRVITLYAQIVGDIALETMLVYFTGGLDSPFSFLYLVSVITASMLLYRRGGLMAASIAALLYGALVAVMYYRLVPYPSGELFRFSGWTATRLYLNMGTNFAGFYATALLTSLLSEQLRETFRELDVNRQNLAELRALNQNVVESIPSGLITVTASGLVSFINPAAMEILGCEQSVVGSHVDSLAVFTREEWEEFSRREPLNVLRGEQEFRRKDEPRTLGYAITPLKTLQGEAYGLTLIFQDLTEMKQLEAQLRMKDRMAAVGELSAGIAHEIRNPLAAIAGSVQVLRNSSSLRPQEQRLMSIILKESDRLNKSISDFLRFVRPQERQPARFDIAQSLKETLELLSNSSELTERHRIEPSIDPASFQLVGDSDQIRQVFWNVARNAIQAMPDGGTLSVFARALDGEYRIDFADVGQGMSDEDQRRLFQPFRTGFASGTGLGMAISFRIVQEHGGRFEVVSVPARGTRITIILPLTPRTASPQPKATA